MNFSSMEYFKVLAQERNFTRAHTIWYPEQSYQWSVIERFISCAKEVVEAGIIGSRDDDNRNTQKQILSEYDATS